MRPRNVVILVAAVGLAVLHQDFWFWSDSTLVFGFLPVGLAYHVAYSLAAAVFMWCLVRFAWPEEIEHTTRLPGTGRE
jgi:hypothetical protein